MVTVRGDNFANTIYQDDYGYELDIYAYGGNDRIYLNISGPNGGFNFVDAGSGNDQVFNIYEGGNDIDLNTGSDYYVGSGFSTNSGLYDIVRGYDGNDVFEISTFHSDYYGEADNDTFYSAGFNNLFDGGSGTDVVSYELQDTDPDLGGHGVVIDLEREFANTKGTDFEEILRSIENAVGSGAADDIYGSSGVNSLWGSAGGDFVFGDAGNDALYGEDGNDRLDGGSGADALNGGTGNDVYVLGAENDTIADAAGIDTVTSTVSRSILNLTSTENLSLLGTANINGYGNSLANTIIGNSGNNVLEGRGGRDILNGGNGNDAYVLAADNDTIIDSAGLDTVTSAVSRSILNLPNIENLTLVGTSNIDSYGNAASNVIVGNSGNNILSGRAGNDVLIGAAGTDSFLFETAPNASTNFDTITDFSVADDTIRLNNSIFTAFAADGAILSSMFVNDTTGLAHDSNDFLIYDRDTGNLFYDSNGSGAGGSVLIASLTANLPLTFQDFLIV